MHSPINKRYRLRNSGILEAVMRVNLRALNDSQTRFAEHIGLVELVGERAKDAIEDILYKNVIDIATSAQRIKELQNSLNTILEDLAKVSEGLSEYVEAAPPEYEEALIHIRFQRDASISNIVDLRKWGNAWFEIGRAIALANQLAPEDIRAISASRGSLVYDLAVAYGVANTLTAITLLVLKVADRVLEIRKKAEELRSMQLTNDKAAQELEKEAQKVEEEGQATVLEKIKSGKNLNGEQENALSGAIGKIFEFISGGGEIDIHIEEVEEPEEGDESEQAANEQQRVIAQIRESFKEIKQLEKKLLLLKDKHP